MTLFKLFPLTPSPFVGTQRVNGYTILLFTSGKGKLTLNFGDHRFSGGTLMCFSPYEPFKISYQEKLTGYGLTFHPDFFCVYKHHKEVACNGVLFDNIYHSPLLSLSKKETEQLLLMTKQMKNEIDRSRFAHQEVLVSMLKIFLINATRIKVKLYPNEKETIQDYTREPVILHRLKIAIEDHYKEKHSARAYAELLNISTRALSKLTKVHFNKTLTELISERVCIEAKRELYLTSKTVKQIAYTLGFQDEFYFSRFFKNKSKVSPQLYRETIGYARAETI